MKRRDLGRAVELGRRTVLKDALLWLGLVLILTLSLDHGASAEGRSGPIIILHPWISLPPNGAPTAAGYLTLVNGQAHADKFLGVASPAAEAIELHTMSMDGGVMRMRGAPEGLVIPPGGALKLAPGGSYHLMVIRPKHPLRVGDRVPAILRFANTAPVKVEFTVEPAPTP